MRRLNLTSVKYLIIYSLVNTFTFAQEGWFWQNPYPPGGGNMSESYFFDNVTAVVVGEADYILKTYDQGNNWKVIPLDKVYNLIDLQFYDKDKNLGFAVGGEGVILKTTDMGEHWVKINSGTTRTVRSIAITDSCVWAVHNGIPNNILIKSTDRGFTWQNVNLSMVWVASVFFINNNVGWVVGGSSVQKTTDAGETWSSLISFNNNTFNGVEIFFKDENLGWINSYMQNIYGLGYGQYKTTDGGLTWTPLGIYTSVKFFFIDQNIGWMHGSAIRKTTDGGITWVNMPNPPTKANSLFFISADTGFIFGDAGKMAKTTDGGSSWFALSKGFYDIITDAFFLDENFGWVVAIGTLNPPEFPIYKTSNSGADWIGRNIITNKALNAIHFYNRQFGIVVGAHGTIFRSTDGGDNWISSNFLSYHYRGVAILDSNSAIVCGTNGAVLKTIDGGENWTYNTLNSNLAFNRLEFVSSQVGYLLAHNGIVFKSTDSGISWTPKNTGFTGITDFNSIKFVNDSIGFIIGGNKIFKTIDSGINWAQLNSPLFLNSVLMSVDFINENIGWLAGRAGVIFFTSDGGVTWIKQTSGTFQDLRSIIFVNRNMGWALGDRGTILKTITAGYLPVELTSFQICTRRDAVELVWSTSTEINNLGFEVQKSNDGVDFFTIGFIKGKGTTTSQSDYSYIDQHPLASFNYYRLKQTDFDGSYSYSLVLSTFWNFSIDLSQNYPNPFNPSTKIKFTIPPLTPSLSRGERVILKVFDILGREVATLVNEELSAGEYEVEFNASDLSSGIYFYKLQVGNFLQNRKMVLMR